jgi:multidrug resistance efflux pump
MFTPGPPPKFEELTQSSRAAPAPATIRQRLVTPKLRRMLRFALAAGLVAIGALALLGEYINLKTDNAVVSGARLLIRAPVAGNVVQAPPRLGTFVPAGTLLARIENPRLVQTRHDDLVARTAQLAAQRDSLLRRRAQTEALRAGLLERADAHAVLVSARLTAEMQGAEAVLATRTAQLRQSERDLARRRALVGAGHTPVAEFERTQAQTEIAARDRDVQEAAIRILQVELSASGQGMSALAGANEAAYAVQRADELAIRLVEIEQALDANTAERLAAQASLAAERAELSRQGEAVLVTADNSMVWRQSVQSGAFVEPGNVIAELVDCSRAIVLAAVSQGDVPTLEVGGIARVGLAGETRTRMGRVAAVVAEASLLGDASLAATPAQGRRAMAVAMIVLDDLLAGADECLIGRTGHVVLPRREQPGLMRWLAGWL